MNLILFLGSGISFPSNLPNTEKITNSVLFDAWHHNSDRSYSKGDNRNPSIPDIYTPSVQKFLSILKDYADKFFKKINGKEANYEDLYYLSQQINHYESRNLDNPAIELFINYIKDQIADILKSKNIFDEYITLCELSNEVCLFIKCVLCEKLSINNELIGLDLIRDLAQSSKINKLDIFTVNHDCLIEILLHHNGIKFIDGFDLLEGDVRHYKPDLFDRDIKIRLFKLHGSINWFTFTKENKHSFIGISNHNDIEHCQDSNKTNLTCDIAPIILTGTYNKLRQYSFGLFDDLQYQFRKSLNNNNIIIMSGYGWNDFGINAYLYDWLEQEADNKIILLHEKPEEITPKPFIRHKYEDFVEEEKLVLLRKWLKDVSIEELEVNLVLPKNQWVKKDDVKR